MKLQLAELTLEKKDSNEQIVLQRLKVSQTSCPYQSKPSDCNRIYDLLCTKTDVRVRVLGIMDRAYAQETRSRRETESGTVKLYGVGCVKSRWFPPARLAHSTEKALEWLAI